MGDKDSNKATIETTMESMMETMNRDEDMMTETTTIVNNWRWIDKMMEMIMGDDNGDNDKDRRCRRNNKERLNYIAICWIVLMPYNSN